MIYFKNFLIVIYYILLVYGPRVPINVESVGVVAVSSAVLDGPMSHDFYQYQQMARYPDHCPDATYFQNWVLNGVNGHHTDIPVSPESYGMCTPSPTEYHPLEANTITRISTGV